MPSSSSSSSAAPPVSSRRQGASSTSKKEMVQKIKDRKSEGKDFKVALMGEALRECQEQLERCQNPKERIQLLTQAGRLSMRLQEWEMALSYFKEQMSVTKKEFGPHHVSIFLLLHQMAIIHEQALGAPEIALVKYTKALNLEYEAFGECHKQVSNDCPKCDSTTQTICEHHAKLARELSTQIEDTKKCIQQLHDKMGEMMDKDPEDVDHTSSSELSNSFRRDPEGKTGSSNVASRKGQSTVLRSIGKPEKESELKREQHHQQQPKNHHRHHPQCHSTSGVDEEIPVAPMVSPNTAIVAVKSSGRTQYTHASEDRREDKGHHRSSRSSQKKNRVSFENVPSSNSHQAIIAESSVAVEVAIDGKDDIDAYHRTQVEVVPTSFNEFPPPAVPKRPKHQQKRVTSSGSASERGSVISKTSRKSSSESSTGSKLTPSRVVVIGWILLGFELALDLVTSAIAFIALSENFECCDETVDFEANAARLLGITIPFFVLVYVELVVLLLQIKQYCTTSRKRKEKELLKFHKKKSYFSFLGSTVYQKTINILLLLNPFFGFFLAYLLLYQSNQTECFIVLGLEAGSLLIHWLNIYLEGLPQNWLSIMIHLLPIIPFAVTVYLILEYMQAGGVCYFPEDSYFWYEGCRVCSNNTLPGEDGFCNDGTVGQLSGYCGNETRFCFFQMDTDEEFSFNSFITGN